MCASRALSLLLCTLRLLGATASEGPSALDSEAAEAALVQEDQCGEEAHCALNAVQLRGQKVAGHGSCEKYGCGVEFDRHKKCQCNELCASYGDCCEDYVALCNASALSPSPPKGPGDDEGGSEGGEAASAGQPDTKVYGHPDPKATYPTYTGFTLALVEEFNAPLDLDTDPIWTWSDGGLIEGQIRFVKEAITFRKGKMVISVSKMGVPMQPCSNAEAARIKPKNFTSGELRTRHNMFRYGRYEARLKAPSVQPNDVDINGNYIATMFVFRGAKYRHWREIDFEITGDSPYSVTTNVLSADNTVKWSQSIAEDRSFNMSFNVRQDFHVYAFEWLPDRITWFVDGKVVRQKAGGRVAVPDLSGKIMMNLWMFDDRALFGGPEIANNEYPLYSQYDWFRFYRWNGEKTYPCKGMTTACLSADDQYLSSNNPCDGIAQTGSIYGKDPCIATCASKSDAEERRS